jgi:hypothetical protein
MSGHVRGKKKGKFCACAVSGGACECRANFRYTNVPPWGKPYQAHHLLPVTCVNSSLVSKRGIQGVLRKTVWCINKKKNMYGMPVWGDTVQYYCRGSQDWLTRPAPPFKNVPQHSYDHSEYNWETNKELKQKAENWRTAQHQVTDEDIAGYLNGFSGRRQTDLKDRGIRSSGTHDCWTAALEGRKLSTWFRPFSMAANPSKRSFPAKRNKRDWLKRIAKALNARG